MNTATTETYTLSLHDALPIWIAARDAPHIELTREHILACRIRDHGTIGRQRGMALDQWCRDQWPRALDHPLFWRSEEHTSELQSRGHLVCRLLLEKKKIQQKK